MQLLYVNEICGCDTLKHQKLQEDDIANETPSKCQHTILLNMQTNGH